MKTQDNKKFIIDSIKNEEIFRGLKPVIVSANEDRISVAMVSKGTGAVDYVLEFSIKYHFVIKYDCFDHLTSAYELEKFERIAHNIGKDAE